jgi:hypothetical protein
MRAPFRRRHPALGIEGSDGAPARILGRKAAD